ncbi:helix-turn-helix transcriptional regulator [Cryobacterium arcticum]|uniref:Helix-turn-helix transcriptional regulator n=1 Tax=Cryobacterium arcticum TaxID=670052 RepID=A0A317ZP93_9MICO|nr:LuxR family transcriptional regulator [Cryobacterium arcticum]PXA68276.1 helix-turn-helix transcriptional regulator [Cryobacterium arcticum]
MEHRDYRPAVSLLGRSAELELLQKLILGARNGESSALVIRGEPGVGKTALLRCATESLRGTTLVRVDGFEAEAELAYAGLQRLCAPLTPFLDAVPSRQRDAVQVAIGVADGLAPERYLVGLGVLSLLAAAGQTQPLLCVIDDAHQLDRESLEVLAFVARRLQAESVVLLFAARDGDELEMITAGVPTLRLGGLDSLSAAQLMKDSAAGAFDPYLAARIAEQTGGNPLAMIDLAQDFTLQQLTDASVSDEPFPIGRRLELHYRQQLRTHPDDVQAWLLLAAAERTGSTELIDQAAERLGLGGQSSALAERSGLVSFARDTVSFRHPLVRSAVYNAFPLAERRRMHGALAAASAERGLLDDEARHAAAAASDTDDDVADLLEAAADRAGLRGALSSRARSLARAADLTSDTGRRSRRLLAAAESAAGAGAAQFALSLLDKLHADGMDAVARGRSITLRAMLAVFLADPAGVIRGPRDLLAAADAFHGVAPELEQRTLIRAFELALTTEWMMHDVTLDQLGVRLREGATVQDGPLAVALRALSAHVLLPYHEAVPLMREALMLLQQADDSELLDLGVFGVALATGLWDERACVELLERSARAARDAGSLRGLDTTLWVLSISELVRGDPIASGLYIEQVRELRRAIGYAAEQVVNASYLAWSGAPRAEVEAAAQTTLGTGFGGAHTIAQTGLSVRDIAEGHYVAAFDRLGPMVNRPFLQVTYQQLPDYVEAAARSGHLDIASAAARQLRGHADISGTPWIRGLADRCAALLAPDADAEPLYVAAIGWLEQSTAIGDLARAHLLYGEWLRRMKRRRDAREQLRAAVAIFERVGAPPFAARARSELAATGEHSQRTEVVGVASLTPRESTIASMAAAGRTNQEISSTLFISTNTVDYHLRKVFRKLGASSRRQLAEILTP